MTKDDMNILFFRGSVIVNTTDFTNIINPDVLFESNSSYISRREFLKKLFEQYVVLQGEDPLRIFMDKLLLTHQDFCKRSKSIESIRRHNSFVLKFVGKKTLREIARQQAVHIRTISKDIDTVLDNMMVLIFGIDGIRPPAQRNETKAAAKRTNSRREITQAKP